MAKDPDSAGAALIKQMQQQGMTRVQIAKTLRLHPQTVRRLTEEPAVELAADPRDSSTVHYWRPAR